MFKNFIDKFTGKDNRMKSPLETEEHKADKKDDPNEKEAEEGYYGVQAEKTEDTSKSNLFKRLKVAF